MQGDKRLPENDNLTMMDILGMRDKIKKEIEHFVIPVEEVEKLKQLQEEYNQYLKSTLSDKEKKILGLI